MLGAKWKGTGAYSNSYQKVTDGHWQMIQTRYLKHLQGQINL